MKIIVSNPALLSPFEVQQVLNKRFDKLKAVVSSYYKKEIENGYTDCNAFYETMAVVNDYLLEVNRIILLANDFELKEEAKKYLDQINQANNFIDDFEETEGRNIDRTKHHHVMNAIYNRLKKLQEMSALSDRVLM